MAGNGPALRRRRSLAGNVFFGSRLCENASAKRATLKSISQFALYSTIDPSGIPKRPPKTRSFRVFTRPYMDTARFAKLIFM